MSASRYFRLLVFVCLSALSLTAYAIEPATPMVPNSDPTYQQLRNLSLGSEAVSVNNVNLHRDAATFHLRSGTVCFVTPVQGKVTGAVFVGDGNMILDPPVQSEVKSLSRLTKEEEFSEIFDRMVLRFSDNTYDEIKNSGSLASGGCDAGLFHDSQNALRKRLRYNLSARILQDVLSTEPGQLFVAFIHGKRYNDKLLYAIDPHGVPGFAEFVYRDDPIALPLAPEEVVLMTYDDNKYGYWSAFHLSKEYKEGTATGSQKNGVIHIERQQLDTTIEKNARLSGKATTTAVVQVNGLCVVPFDLYRTLRVESVTEQGGQPLSFIQEDKNEDFQLFVILAKPLFRGDKVTLETAYGGKDAVLNEGNGNYFPVARENWYPNRVGGALGDYSNYQLIFRIPKGMKMAATGDLIRNAEEEGKSVTVWESPVPLTVAGFNFGKFREQETKLTKPEFLVQSYANEEPPDMLRPVVGRAALGTLSTVSLMKKPLAEAELAVGLYTDYFGPVPYHRLAMAQQTACTFGQSWPQLVWLPICSFFDTTQRHQFGLDFRDRGYWKIVAPHEVAHQWWGHTVGFNSYRDQWMSEGFAEMSASLFLQMIEKDPRKFITFWNDEREILLEKNAQGFRGIDAGALTMGYRAGNTKTGINITRDLIYPKGAYVLHMIRMMMWDRRTGDENFKATMHDFVQTYTNRAATTEDFKAMVEKHMTQEMDLEGNRKMDWFFNEYVYGTSLPSYQRTGLPGFFTRIWGSRILGVTRSAKAEVYNPSGQSVPIQVHSVKPWLIPNGNPNFYFDSNYNIISGNGFIGRTTPTTFSLNQDLTTAPPPPTSASVQFYAIDIPITPLTPVCPSTNAVSCSNLGGGSPPAAEYEENIACSGMYSVKSTDQIGPASPVSPPNSSPMTMITPVTGNIKNATVNGTQCLIHADSGSVASGSGQDAFTSTGVGAPVTISGGYNNPNPALQNALSISRSDSVVTVPVYNDKGLAPCSASPVTCNQQLQIIGFLQLGIQYVDGSNSIHAVILNAAGSNPANVGTPPIRGGEVSPIPVRLIQ